MAKNGLETVISEILKNYLVDFIGVIIFFRRASCRMWVGFCIFARRSLSVLLEAAFPKDFSISRFLAEFTLSYANVLGSDRSHPSIPLHPNTTKIQMCKFTAPSKNPTPQLFTVHRPLP